MKDPKDAQVTVIVDSTNPPAFRFETDDVPMQPNNVLVFADGKGNSGFHVHYRLEGADGYRFPENLDEALYVTQGSKTACPKQPAKWGQFQAIGLSDDRRTLKVWNKNESERDFAYTLRATNGGGWLELDPGGINQNGGGDSD